MVMAYVYTLNGEYDDALDQIELLLSIPAKVSMAWLEADPIWEPLRDHPRFMQLLAGS